MKITNDKPETLKLTKQDNTTEVICGVIGIEYVNYNIQQIISYSQRDDRWKTDLMMGNNTIGGWGCAMACGVMLISQFNPEVTPKTLNQWLKQNNGYTSDNRLVWSKITEFEPRVQFVNYHLWRNIAANIPLLIEKLQVSPHIIQVDFRPGGALDTHFVLALSSDSNDIDIIDPWDGSHTKLLQRYALSTWDLSRAVYAMVDYEIG